MFTLEIAAHSLQSCLAARDGGADRIELCSALQTGGLTPAMGLLELVRDQVHLPIHVLIRPRPGDFIYTESEIKEMVASIEKCNEVGADGIVIGCLDEKGNIDSEHIKELMDTAEGMSVTFHRAFDLLQDPRKALDDIIKLGFDRILTSGQARSAPEGKELLGKLVSRAGEAITILAAAGINSYNIADLVLQTGCHEFHGSAKRPHVRKEGRDHLGITTQTGTGVSTIWESEVQEVRAMKEILVRLETDSFESV